MSQGTIAKIVADRGFGFISGESGEVFFHHTSVEEGRFDGLRPGQAVEYELDGSPDSHGRNRGPRAALVKAV